MDSKNALQNIARFTQGLTLVLFVAVLYLAKDVFIPLALGGLFAFLLSPVVNRLQRLGVSNVLAVMITAATVFAVLSLFLIAVWTGIQNVDREMPNYRAQLRSKLETGLSAMRGAGGSIASITETVEEVTEDVESKVEDPAEDEENQEGASWMDRMLGGLKKSADGSSPKTPLYVVQAPSGKIDLQSWAGGVAAVLGPIGTAGLVTVFALFSLLYRDDLRDRFTSLISHGNYVVTSEAMNEASRRISKYLLAQLILNCSYGLFFSLGLLVIGYFLAPNHSFPYVVLLGAIAGVVRFIPYIGPVIGACIPLLLALVMFPGYGILVAIALLIITMELISNNFVEPWLYGSSTGVSPVAVILAAVFWGWLWGPIGLLLATPLTVCVVVLGQYVPRFRFLTTLLSEEINVKSSIRAYQRLLSNNEHKTEQLFRSELEESSTAELLDRTVVPLVKLVLKDDDKLNDAAIYERLATALIAVEVLPKTAIEVDSAEKKEDEETDANHAERESELPVAPLEGPAESTVASEKPLPTGVAIAARHRGESIVLEAIGHELRETIRFFMLDNDDLPDRESDEIAVMNPSFVVVGVIPPSGLSQAKYWCTALRNAGYRGVIVVACLGKFRNYDNLFTSFRKRGANWVTTTAEQTMNKLQRIVEKETRSTIAVKTKDSVSVYNPSKEVCGEPS